MERKQFLKTALLVNAAIIAKPLLAMAKGFVIANFPLSNNNVTYYKNPMPLTIYCVKDLINE